MLVWKFLENEFIRNEDGTVALKKEQKIKEIADLPVLACVKTISGLAMSNKLVKY